MNGEVSTAAAEESSEISPAPERRRYPRFACDGPIEVAVFDAEFLFRGEIRDLSLAGCYVRTRARLRLRRGVQVELRFSLSGEHVKCLARVMSFRAGAGAGFGFEDLEDKARKTIGRLIEQLNSTSNTTQAQPQNAG